MRVKSKWTPSGIILWLVAAIVATVVVCSKAPPPEAVPMAPVDIDFEVETIE